MSTPCRVVIALYPGITHLDFTGPHQFFAHCPEMAVVVASRGAQPVSSYGLVFDGLADLDQVRGCDVLCVPGGLGCLEAAADRDFIAAIQRLAANARFVTSVCTGSLILGAAGLLAGRRAACHWAWRDLLPMFGAVPDEARIVTDGRFITGGGVTAEIDFALTVIAACFDEATAQTVQLQLEYAPEPPFAAGRPEIAPAAVRTALLEKLAPAMAERRSAAARIAQYANPD